MGSESSQTRGRRDQKLSSVHDDTPVALQFNEVTTYGQPEWAITPRKALASSKSITFKGLSHDQKLRSQSVYHQRGRESPCPRCQLLN